jgi:hypothetical protein
MLAKLKTWLCALVGHNDAIVAGYCICTRCDDFTKFGWRPR